MNKMFDQNHQKLINYLFQFAIVIKSSKKLQKLSNDKLVDDYIRPQLKELGFDTTPMGSFWGMLINKDEKNKI
jgi:hypothetical protein